MTRTPGIISREKIAEARCTAWICDHRRAAAELAFRGADVACRRSRQNARLVQGGRLAQVLTPRPANREFWPVDKVILCVLRAQLHSDCGLVEPDPGRLVLLHVARRRRSRSCCLEVKRPNPTSWVFRNWYPVFLRSHLLQGDGAVHPRRAPPTPTSGSPTSISGSGSANPTVWLERIYSPVLTEFLQVVYTLFIPAVLFVACCSGESGASASSNIMLF